MDFFVEQGKNAMNSEGTISGNDVNYCSEEERKMMWMRETRIRTFTQIELKSYRDELDWLLRCHKCALNSYPAEYCPYPLLLIMPNIW